MEAILGKGINGPGYDGVLCTFDRDRNVVDAVGLNPAQVREYYAGVPLPPRFVTADGHGKSRWDKFHLDAENVPRKFPEKDRAEMRAHNEEIERRGFTCGNPRVDKGGDES